MIINYILDSIIFILLILIIVVVIVRLRNKLLTLWSEVSRLELTFHNKLFETLHIYLSHQTLLEKTVDSKQLAVLKQYESDHVKELTLTERQTIFKSLQSLYLEIDTLEHPALITLQKQFDELQSCRLKYNSKVIYYNHFIVIFPVRLLARRMHVSPKEYFG